MQRLPSHTKSFSRQLRKEMTEAEAYLWRYLRMRQVTGVKFRRQHPCGIYIIDFVCISAKLAIELDGGHHSEFISQDNIRTGWLEQQGWKVLRFWNNEVMQNIEGVLEVIYSEINK